MKKVAIIYSGAKHWGGIETLTLNLFKYYQKEKVELVFFSLGNWPLAKKIKELGAETVVFSKTRFQPLTILKIAREAKKRNVKLFVSGGLVADSYCRAASLFSGIKHLSMVHSSFNLDYPDKIKRGVYRFLISISRWRTSHYITVSEFLKKELVKKGIKPEKIKVIYNGVTLNVEPKKKIPGKTITITSVGRLHPVKGYDLLIPAMKEVSGAHLLIYGEGIEKSKLQKLIDGNNLSDSVRLAGFASDTLKVYEKTDIYVQPSLSEGFGLGVVEAMLYGLPIVVTPCGSLPEIIEDDKTGKITKSTDPEDIAYAINELVRNPKKREELGEAARKYAMINFDIKNWAKKVTETFLEVTE